MLPQAAGGLSNQRLLELDQMHEHLKTAVAVSNWRTIDASLVRSGAGGIRPVPVTCLSLIVGYIRRLAISESNVAASRCKGLLLFSPGRPDLRHATAPGLQWKGHQVHQVRAAGSTHAFGAGGVFRAAFGAGDVSRVAFGTGSVSRAAAGAAGVRATTATLPSPGRQLEVRRGAPSPAAVPVPQGGARIPSVGLVGERKVAPDTETGYLHLVKPPMPG